MSISFARGYGDAAINSGLVASDCERPGEPEYGELGRMLREQKRKSHLPDDDTQQRATSDTFRPRGFEFKPFTPDSLKNRRPRRDRRASSTRNYKSSDNENQGTINNVCLDPAEPDPYLASGQQLPPILARQFPPELVGRPIEDIDPYYSGSDTFVIISRGRELTRFSASQALCLFGPFHPIRRIVLCILVNPIFNLLVMLTIVTNCILMTLKGSDSEEKTEYIFTIVYTTEMGLKVLARGFIMEKFTYLRDPWNWLDFAVIIMAYLTIVVEDLGNLSVMRTFRVLRALKTVAIIPGMKTIVGAVIDSVKNLKDVVVLTLFSLSVFSLSGLQIYMGQLTQKCILDGPSNMTNIEWFNWSNDSSHWVTEPNSEIQYNSFRLCGNATGAQSCPLNHTCLQGFGPNPDYGFTNFDTFGWSLICSFRLMTQDYWEGLYMQLLKTAGSWHIIYFIISIFLGSIYLMNLILAIVAMSYNELQRRAEEEEEAAAEEEAAFLESCRQIEQEDQYYFDQNNNNINNIACGQQQQQQNQFGGSGRRKSSTIIRTVRGSNSTAFRPSIEIDLVDQSLLAAGLNSSSSMCHQVDQPEQQQLIIQGNAKRATSSNRIYLRPANEDSNNDSAPNNDNIVISLNANNGLRSHSLTGHETQFKRDLNRTRQLANPGDINQAQVVHPNLVASMTELRHPPDPSARNISQIKLEQPINYNYDRKNGDNASIRSKKGRKKYILSRFILPSQNSDSESKLIELKRRAASIRIVSDDYTGDENSKQSGDSNDNQQGDQNNQFDTGRLGVDPSKQKTRSQNVLNQVQQPTINSAWKSGPMFSSDGVICEQPRSINAQVDDEFIPLNSHQCIGSAGEPKTVAQKTVSSCIDMTGNAKTPSNKSFESDYSATNGSNKMAISLHSEKSSLENIMNIQHQFDRSRNNQLGIDLMIENQARSPHHLSVENFYKFGLNSSENATNLAHSNCDTQLSTPIISPTRDITRSLQNRAGQIHPNVMARSSFAWPRASLMPDSIPAGQANRLSAEITTHSNNDFANGSADLSQNNQPTSIRRLSQQEYMRRASNWSRLSMSGNTDMRRLLRLWAHTNPYHMNQNNNNGDNNYQSRASPANSIVSQNMHQNRDHRGLAQSPNYSNYHNNLNSPRPSSVGSARQAYELISALSRRRSRFGFDQRYGLALEDANMMVGYDQVSVTFRDKCLATCLSWLDTLCIWECCDFWLRIQKLISIIVFDPFTELFIILCILINTLFMALDSDDAGEDVKSFLDRGNYFFTATFAVEASMKIMALSPKFYFREGWNVFDAIIVGLSLLELGLEGVYGLSVLRSFRLLRVFKLAKSWPTLNLLISIMGKAIGDLGNLTFVLAIIVFIFAVMGMQLFGNKYVAENFPHGELPRWNFTDFMHSFMIVFRILCAEWIEPMWDCLLVGGWPCIPFFLIAVTVGNLVVLNLFLALLLASFGASNLSSPQSDNVDTKKLNEAIERFRRFARWSRKSLRRICQSVIHLIRISLGFKSARDEGRGGRGDSGKAGNRYGSTGGAGGGRSAIVAMSRLERKKNIEIRTELLRNKIRNSNSESPEMRKHRNLSLLAKSQARERGFHNFDYNNYYNNLNNNNNNRDVIQQPGSKATSRNERPKIKVQSRYQSSDFTPSSKSHPSQEKRNSSSIKMGNTIPIIIDEAIDSKEENFVINQANHNCSNEPVAGPSSLPVDFDEQNNSLPFSSNSLKDNARDILHPIREADSSANSEAESISLNLNISDRDDEDNDKDSASHRLNFLEPSSRDQKPGSNQGMEPKPLESQARPATLISHQHQHQQQQPNQLKANQEPKDKQPKQSQMTKMIPDMEEEDERTLLYVESYIERCICMGIICLKFFLFRRFVRKVVEHRYFDQAILALIVISSGTLALEDKHLNDRPLLKRTLDALDTIFTIVFSLEMLLKWLAFGIKRYFSNIWSWLDFLIVLVSFINLMASIFGSGKIQALKTMRTLRAMRGLRPLRALQRFQGMRVVVNALIQAIPSIFNVLLVCLIFWLIFSIMGVQMFGGKFWRCLDPAGELVSEKLVDNKQQCLERNLTWSNPQINFDNVLNAYLALFQVAIFKGWIEIMNSATDSRARDDQPIREANIYMYFYFVFFVIFGSFFTLNLFIGVIIDNFNEQKKKTGGSLEIFMTDDQKKYYHAMKKMKSKRPVKAMTRPKFKFQALLFDITTSRKFDMTIMLIIGVNMFVMALEHYGQSQEFSIILENLNLLFIAIFTLECLCKIFAMRHFYFREPWNVFDFIVVCLSILGVVMKEYVAKYFVSPTLLRVVRVVKVGRVLRLVKGAKGIRTLLFALAMSLPALFNICLLLFLVMFIYAIFGMSFFMNVRKRSGLDETFNFETFTSSIIVLFQMSTSAGWDVVLDPLMDEENDCQKPDPVHGIEGTCGNKTIAILYLMSYVIVTFLIIINMYIAVILENYSQATEDVQEGLTDDDYEMYYEIWQKFDPNGTQFLTLDKLSDFLDTLEDPLRIAKPNDLAIVVLDINIYEGDRCYCVDILDALTKYFFARKGLNIQVNEHLEKVQSSIMHETRFQKITTTYMIKREHYCAKLIQNCWRKWRQASLEKSHRPSG